MRRRSQGGLRLLSWVAVALAVAMLVMSSRWIWGDRPLPATAPGAPSASANGSLAAADTARDDFAELSRDPFRSGGLLPNDVARLRPAPDTVLPVSVAAIRLLGTVVRASGSFALCQLPPDVPRMVHIGERLGEFTLISLEQGHVVFQAPKGARLELFLSNSRS